MEALLDPSNPNFAILILILSIWTIPWKALALWHASKIHGKIWFFAIVVLNTFGILEILYLFVFAKQKLTKEIFKEYIKLK